MTDDDLIAAGQLPRITWPERGLMGFAPTVTKDNAGAMLALARRIPDAVVEWPAASLAEVRTRLNQIGAMWVGLDHAKGDDMQQYTTATRDAAGHLVFHAMTASAPILLDLCEGDGSGDALPDAPILLGNVVEYGDGCMTITCTPSPNTIRWPDDPALYALAERLAVKFSPTGRINTNGLNGLPCVTLTTTAKPPLAGLTTCNDRTDSAGRSPYLGIVG